MCIPCANYSTHLFCSSLYFYSCLPESVQICTQVEADVHGGDESAGKVLDVHFGHVSEMAAEVGWHVEDADWFLFDVDQGVFAEVVGSSALGLEVWVFQQGHFLEVVELKNIVL